MTHLSLTIILCVILCAQTNAAQYQTKRIDDAFVVQLATPHRVLSNSYVNGGIKNLTTLVNHQSVKPDDFETMDRILQMGRDHYHRQYLRALKLNPEKTVLMGTMANMDTIAYRQAVFSDEKNKPLKVNAWISAGVCGNALSAGDSAKWYQAREGNKAINYSGTINTLIVINYPLTDGALIKAAMVATEAKARVMQELQVPSTQSKGIATGTGTDQMIIAAPLKPEKNSYRLDSASGHLKVGELIGRTVREATLAALVNQQQVVITQQGVAQLQCKPAKS